MVDGPPGPLGTLGSPPVTRFGRNQVEMKKDRDRNWRLLPRPGIRVNSRGWFLTKAGNLSNLGIEDKGLQKELNEISDHVNDLEESEAKLEAELQEVKEQMRSLRQDLHSFSTFEQICNSGMLRNFKIDTESEFAQTILGLLQKTMELQIHHLSEVANQGNHLVPEPRERVIPPLLDPN